MMIVSALCQNRCAISVCSCNFDLFCVGPCKQVQPFPAGRPAMCTYEGRLLHVLGRGSIPFVSMLTGKNMLGCIKSCQHPMPGPSHMAPRQHSWIFVNLPVQRDQTGQAVLSMAPPKQRLVFLERLSGRSIVETWQRVCHCSPGPDIRHWTVEESIYETVHG